MICYNLFFDIYLRNKETQQTLRVTKFLVQIILSIGAVCVRQITAGSTALSIT